jgi:hypothetical protein
VLDFGFGAGVWHAAGPRRRVRLVGALILAQGALDFVWPFAPMHLRETLAAGGGTASDAAHIALGAVTSLLALLTIGIGASAFGTRFRRYSWASIGLMLVFGALTFLSAPNVGANRPTPLLGVWERVDIALFVQWQIALAARLLGDRRIDLTPPLRTAGRSGP